MFLNQFLQLLSCFNNNSVAVTSFNETPGWTNVFLDACLFGGAILLAHPIRHAKMDVQNQSVRPIEKQLEEKLLFVLY